MTSMKFGRTKKKQLTCENGHRVYNNKWETTCSRCGSPNIREMNAEAVKEHRRHEAELTPTQQALIERLLEVPNTTRKRATSVIAQLTTDRPEGDGVTTERMVALIAEMAAVHEANPLNDPASYLVSLARGNVRPDLPVDHKGTILPRAPGRANGISQRLCCDYCELPFWINELVMRDGLATCSTCAGGPKERQENTVFAAPPPSEAQRAWDELHAAIEAEYEAAVEDACPAGSRRQVAVRVLELTQGGESATPFEQSRRERGAVAQAMREIVPGIAAAKERRRDKLAQLGLRPLGSAEGMRRVSMPARDQAAPKTPAAVKVEAYWRTVNAG